MQRTTRRRRRCAGKFIRGARPNLFAVPGSLRRPGAAHTSARACPAHPTAACRRLVGPEARLRLLLHVQRQALPAASADCAQHRPPDGSRAVSHPDPWRLPPAACTSLYLRRCLAFTQWCSPLWPPPLWLSTGTHTGPIPVCAASPLAHRGVWRGALSERGGRRVTARVQGRALVPVVRCHGGRGAGVSHRVRV